MEPKWKVFIFTFLSYALVHASRTAWSSLKYTLNSTPFSFSPVYLGTLDMMVLVALATTLVLFGPKVVTGGPKEYLQKGMIVVSLILTALGIMLLFNVTVRSLYLIIYPFVGVFSFVGWPACLYILSLHFEKGIAFSLWNGCIQFGDFLAILLSFVFVQAAHWNPGVYLFFMASLVFIVAVISRRVLSEVKRKQLEPLPQESPAQKYVQELAEQKGVEHAPSNQELGATNSNLNTHKKVNFLTVWLLPGVPGYMLSLVFIKTVYAMISTWLVFYLSMINMVKQAHIIALLWSSSTFVGGVLGIYVNRRLERKYFVILLFLAAIFFVFLEEMHIYPNQAEVVILIICCGIAFGGPYAIMNTSIPIHLSQKPQIKQYPGAKAAIISAMEGYSLLFCGFTIIFVPAVGVFDVHWVACIYCVIAACILIRQLYKDHEKKIERELEMKKHASKPVVRGVDGDANLSADLQGARGKKKKRTRRTTSKSIRQSDRGSVSSKEEHKDGDLKQYNSERANNQQPQKQLFPSKHSIGMNDDIELPKRDNHQPLDILNENPQPSQLNQIETYNSDGYKEMNEPSQYVNAD